MAITDKKLITKEEVVQLAFRDKQFPVHLIGDGTTDTVIEVAQLQHIKPILTEDLYDKLVADNIADTVTGLFKTLLDDFVKPALAYFVKAEALQEIITQLVAAGAQVQDTEFTNQATNEQRANLEMKIISHARTLGEQITLYIEDEDNIDTFDAFYEIAGNIENRLDTLGNDIIIEDDD